MSYYNLEGEWRIGVDPGRHGYAAAVSNQRIILLPLRFVGDAKDFDSHALELFCDLVGPWGVSSVTIERPSYFGPGRMGGQALAEMMRAYGAIECTLLRKCSAIARVAPVTWKRARGLLKQPKEKSKELAQEEIKKRCLSFFCHEDGKRFYKNGSLSHDACEAILIALHNEEGTDAAEKREK